MAEIHRTTLEPTKLELLTSWLPQQRWYAAKGRIPSLRKLGGFRLDDPAGEVGIEVMVVADESGEQPVVYQVPMTYRAAPLPGADGALIGTTEHGVLGRRWVYDAPHDDVYVSQLLALVQGRTQAQAQSESHTLDPTVEGHAVDADVVTLATSSVLRGEQSNTSVVCQVVDATGAAAEPVIIKVFRSLHPGENPDVVVQSALTEAGSTQVPHTVGSATGEWDDPVSGERARGHLTFAQRFLPGVEDAWRVALRAATASEDFTEPARGLGAATAQIHLSLADTLGTENADDDVKAELVRIIRSRYDAAVAEVPSLAAYEAVVAASLDDLAARDWPDLQRIHGDYHLGQVLRTADGWVAVDFEGEPLRPLHERVRPDLALRDVAGMLRSFDYVGGSVELAEPERSARDWVAASRAAFLEGYAGVTHLDPVETGPVLRALELDKALYEVSYEVRNRPSWLGIPTAAIERLVSDARSDTSSHTSSHTNSHMSSDTTSDTSDEQGAAARKGPS